MEVTNNYKDVNDINRNASSYIKLLEINSVEIGISKDRNWVFTKGKNVYEFINHRQSEFILWLPILETPYLSFLSTVNTALKDMQLNSNLVESFPITQILATALRSDSEYWVKLALNWCDDIDDLRNQAEDLVHIMKNEKYSQQVRHHAKRLMKKTR